MTQAHSPASSVEPPDLPGPGTTPGQQGVDPPVAASANMAGRTRLMRFGLPREVNAGRNITGFLVIAVTTVLLTRAFLATTGYPQIGGGGLHIAHVLWGGIAMALAMLALLSFSGSVVRPFAAVVGGIGFGLFIDEMGKFVTADNNYFYEPTAALVYCVIVALVFVAEALHGSRSYHPAELLAAATDKTVTGLAGGFTPRARAEAAALARLGQGAPGADQVKDLVAAVPDNATESVDLIAEAAGRIQRIVRQVAEHRWVAPFIGVMVILTSLSATIAGFVSVILTFNGEGVPYWIGFGAMLSGGTSVGCAIRGWIVGRKDPRAGAIWMRRALLISLLLTHILVFRIMQWPAIVGLVVDLCLFEILEYELRGRSDQIRVDTGPTPATGT